MKRDAQATRQRIFEAATEEFAQYGIAGARIDRIAAASGSNKAMIYAYYGSKDALFDAVTLEWIGRSLNDVPVDARHLPEYAAQLFDQYQHFPQMLRLVSWAQLERGPDAGVAPSIVRSYETKLRAIRQAQAEGAIGAHYPPEVLLELVLALILTRPPLGSGPPDPQEVARRRAAIRDAVAALIAL